MLTLFFALVGSTVAGLVVFGGGQTFMPVFGSIWRLMNLDGEIIENAFTVANGTPGVIGTKFALLTGYLAAHGQWWGFLLMIVTYALFFIPSVLLVWFSYKLLLKSTKHKYLKSLIKWINPIIIGIIFSLSIQLFIVTAFPNVIFNRIDDYFGLDFDNVRANFFTNWRFYAVITYTICATSWSFYFVYFKKVRFGNLILIHIVLGMIVFQPWL